MFLFQTIKQTPVNKPAKTKIGALKETLSGKLNHVMLSTYLKFYSAL